MCPIAMFFNGLHQEDAIPHGKRENVLTKQLYVKYTENTLVSLYNPLRNSLNSVRRAKMFAIYAKTWSVKDSLLKKS